MIRDRKMSNNEVRKPPDNSSMEERHRIVDIWRRTAVKLYVMAKGD